MSAPAVVHQLVDRFHADRATYLSADYKKDWIRQDLIDPLFEALWWDVTNRKGMPVGPHREVIPEDAIKMHKATKAPDTDRLALDNELAVVVARNQELLEQLDSGDSLGFRKRLLGHKHAVEAACRSGDAEAEAEHLDALMRVIERGASDAECWVEWKDNVEQLRRLAESERKRRVEEQQMVTAEEVMAMMGAILTIIVRHVPDPRIRATAHIALRALYV